MPERVLRKTFVMDFGVFWKTKARQGVFKLQFNSEPVVTQYSYRIIRINSLLPDNIEAHAYSAEEARRLWKQFTGAEVDL